ncbi:MAG: S41 family peptidase [Bacteroidia bacterium]|nr:S41 family peptidase [Bacteroidia bacterium]
MIRHCMLLLLVVSAAFAQAQPAEAVFRLRLPAGEPAAAIRGNLPPLSWSSSLPLSAPDAEGFCEIALQFPLDAPAVLEYKFLSAGGAWEPSENRVLRIVPGSALRVQAEWGRSAPASQAQFPRIAADAFRQDLDLAFRAYRALHPGLYRYQTSEALEARWAAAAAGLPDSLTFGEAYLRCSRLTAAIRCGHTYANFYNQPAYIQQIIFGQADKLPFAFRILDRRIFLTANLSELPGLDPGTELLRIGGVPASVLLDSLARLVKADGPNDGKRYSDLEVSGYGRFESFDVYFPLLFPPQDGGWTLDVRLPDGRLLEGLRAAAISRDTRKARLRSIGLPEPPLDSLWKFAWLDPQTAWLKLGSFVTWNMGMDWEAFLEAAAAELRSRPGARLLVDIRGNEGGNDEVIYRLARLLASKPVRIPPGETRVRYQTLPPDLEPYLSSWDNSFRDLRRRTRPGGEGYWLLKRDGPDRLPAQRNAFQGPVFLLADAANSSATFYLAQVFRYNQLGTIVGAATGGSRQGLNGGQTAFLRLPHSGIEVDIPLLGTYTAGEPAGGIEPDVPVRWTPEDLIRGRDPVLEAALRLAAGGR